MLHDFSTFIFFLNAKHPTEYFNHQTAVFYRQKRGDPRITSKIYIHHYSVWTIFLLFLNNLITMFNNNKNARIHSFTYHQSMEIGSLH